MNAFDWGPLLQGGPLFIGILNATPDSFSDGGKFTKPEAALVQARSLVAAGAGMLDLGAESTRPGAQPIDAAREWERLEPIIATLRKELPGTPLSLDTRHVEVAAPGLRNGIAVLNDVTGFADPDMLALAHHSRCGLIAMRSRREGTGFLMPPYDDLSSREASAAVAELRTVLERLRVAKVPDSRILLDPGFGFGTTFLEDLALWEALPSLPQHLKWPVDRFCLGISRKRFLATRAGRPDLAPVARDGLTTAAHAEASNWGYRVFRSHAIG